MKKFVIAAIILAGAGAYYFLSPPTDAPGQAGATAGSQGGGRGGRAGGGVGGFARGAGPRQPMTVETTRVTKSSIANQLLVVGNLIGDSTVSVVPRAAGRLQEIYVRLGDRVTLGQKIATIEDFEIQQQVKQAEAALDVSQATIRQREADLKLAETNVERSRNLFQRQLLPKQTLDDNESRYQSGLASLDLARAQHAQSTARLDELRINLANTIITSPADGFIARRSADPGAFASQNQPVVDVVDIGRVRLVANIVEKDLSQLQTGDSTQVEVDAFPGERFTGIIARVAPVLDPATRTASIEIEIPNPKFRLRPGMYARVTIVTDTTKDALVLPSDAVVDLGGRRGVFVPQDDTAVFRMVQVGAEQGNRSEILAGLVEGDSVITTGARALRDGDRVLLPGAARGSGGRRSGGAARDGGSAAPADASPVSPSGRGGAARGASADAPADTPAETPRRGGRGRRGGGASGG